jgi:rod shape-determining protein MreC
MQRLLNILGLFKEYFVLALLLLVSLILLNSNDNRQIRAIRSTTVGFVGALQSTIAILPNLFELQKENEVLRKLNVNLNDEVSRLREAKLENLRLRAMISLKERSPMTLIGADVVGKSLTLLRNTITLNSGTAAGVKTDMAILSESGLVGKIIAASGEYSVGQIIFNKDFRASAKVQRSRVDGIVAWDGGEHLLLKNVPKNQDVKPGDLVVTSEYSSVFPPDLKIGTVVTVSENPGSLFKEIGLSPSVDFTMLEQVFIVRSLPDSERTTLERSLTAPRR